MNAVSRAGYSLALAAVMSCGTRYAVFAPQQGYCQAPVPGLPVPVATVAGPDTHGQTPGGQPPAPISQPPSSSSQHPTPNTQHPIPNTVSPAAIIVPKNAALPLTLSFQLWNGLIIVDAIVSKTSLQHFVIDAGLDACTLSPLAAQFLKIASTSEQTSFTFYDKALGAPRSVIPELQFNTLKLDRVPVGLINVLSLLSTSVSRRLDAPIGWLGAPFLSAFQVTFDYEKRYIVLDRADAKLPKDPTAITVPFELHEGRVMLKVSLPGARPFLALFSTSAPVAVIPTLAAQQARLKSIELLPFAQSGGKLGKVGRVVLPRVSVGKVTLEGMNAVFVAQDAPPELSRTMAVLGPDLLRHYKVTINYARHLIVFVPPPATPAPGTEVDVSDKPKARGQGRGQGRLGSGTN